MISRFGRKGATSRAAACAIAAVSEKLPAAMTPTPASRAASSMSRKSSALSPEDPITTETPRSIAANVLLADRVVRRVVDEDLDPVQCLS